MRLVPRLQLLQPNNFDNMPEWMDFFFWNLKFFENFGNFFFWKFMKFFFNFYEIFFKIYEIFFF